MWDEIIHPFLICNGAAIDVWEWINSSPHIFMYMRAFSLLASWCLRPWWVRILPSAEEDNLSPFDSNIACLCQSIEINNNKYGHVIPYLCWDKSYSTLVKGAQATTDVSLIWKKNHATPITHTTHTQHTHNTHTHNTHTTHTAHTPHTHNKHTHT